MSSVLILSLLVLLYYRAQAIPLTGLLQFGMGASDSSLPTGDDETARAVLANKFGFYGSNYTNLFVSLHKNYKCQFFIYTVYVFIFALLLSIRYQLMELFH